MAENNTDFGKLSAASGSVPIICPGHSRPVPDLQFSKQTQDGYFLISSCLDGKAMIREGATGDWIGSFLGHKGAVWCARLNGTATQAVTASADFTARLWNTLTGDEMHSFVHKHIVKTSIFSKDGTSIITGGHEKKVRVFDLTKLQEAMVISGLENTVSYSSVAADDSLIVTAGDEKGVKVWDKRTQKVAKTLATESNVSSLSLSSDESTLCATSGKEVYFWDAKSFDSLKVHKMPREVSCVAYHPKAKRFVTGSGTELWARLYDFGTGAEQAVHKGHHGPVRCLAFNPAGDAFASGSEDGTIRIWDGYLESVSSSTASAATPSKEDETSSSSKPSASEPKPSAVEASSSKSPSATTKEERKK